jgi:hypothetical protein
LPAVVSAILVIYRLGLKFTVAGLTTGGVKG